MHTAESFIKNLPRKNPFWFEAFMRRHSNTTYSCVNDVQRFIRKFTSRREKKIILEHMKKFFQSSNPKDVW